MRANDKLNRLETRGLLLEARMFEKRSRYLMLLLTLNYKPEYRHGITIEDLRRHRDRLLKNTQCNELLSQIEGYIWKIEEGKRAGLHLHLLVFYSGAHRADVHIAREIGDYWESVITRGQGGYWNSNADKKRLQERQVVIGVGQVNRGDVGCREGIRAIIHYLAKSEQAATGLPRHGRTFGMSELP